MCQIALHNGCTPINLLQIFMKTPFYKNIYAGLLLMLSIHRICSFFFKKNRIVESSVVGRMETIMSSKRFYSLVINKKWDPFS